MFQDLYANVIFNTTTPSSAGAAGAPTFARPLSGSIVQSAAASFGDVPTEIVNDVEWIMAMG